MTLNMRKGSALTMLAIALTLSSGSAYAGKAYQGEDYSIQNADFTKVRACDMESDGFGVHTTAESWNGTSFRGDDPDGSAGAACGPTPYMGSVKRHKTVEERPSVWEPDVVGDWHNH